MFRFISGSVKTLPGRPLWVMGALVLSVAVYVLRCEHTSHTQLHPSITDYIDSLPLTLIPPKANLPLMRLSLNEIARQSLSWV